MATRSESGLPLQQRPPPVLPTPATAADRSKAIRLRDTRPNKKVTTKRVSTAQRERNNFLSSKIHQKTATNEGDDERRNAPATCAEKKRRRAGRPNATKRDQTPIQISKVTKNLAPRDKIPTQNPNTKPFKPHSFPKPTKPNPKPWRPSRTPPPPPASKAKTRQTKPPPPHRAPHQHHR